MTREPTRSVLLTANQIMARARELGEELTRDYRNSEPIFVAVMQGALVFFADLIRHVKLSIRCDAVGISSYLNETTPASTPRLIFPARQDWDGRDVVFVEAIVDTGQTAELLLVLASNGKARTARICTLLDKPSRRTANLAPDYIGFTIQDLFVVGYGLDYRGRDRNLSHVEVLEF